MGISSSWDDTLSPNDFYINARAHCEKWKVINPVFHPWAWVPCRRPFGVASREEEGYLSLEGFCCPRFIKGEIDDGCSSKEEATCITEEEVIDDATLVESNDRELHLYDLHIVRSTSYRVPVLYFRWYNWDGQPLALDDIKKNLPYQSSKILKNSRWTFMTRGASILEPAMVRIASMWYQRMDETSF